MSRCFPFPPPGYEKKPIPEEGDLLKEEKRKEKKHKKEKKEEKREGKGKKDKDRSDGKHREKKDKKEKHRDKKEKHGDKKEKDKEKERSSISEEARVAVVPGTSSGVQIPTRDEHYRDKSLGSGEAKHSNQLYVQHGEKHFETSLPAVVDSDDSKFVQDLGRRIRDEERCGGSQLAGYPDEQKRNENTDKLGFKDFENLVEYEEKNNEKIDCNAKMDGQSVREDPRIGAHAILPSFSGMAKSKIEGKLRPLEDNVDKRREGKEKSKERRVDKARDKNKDKDRDKKSHRKEKDKKKEKKKEKKAKDKSEQDKSKDINKTDVTCFNKKVSLDLVGEVRPVSKDVASVNNSNVPLVSKDSSSGFCNKKVPLVSKDSVSGFCNNKVPLVSKDSVAGFCNNKVPLVSKDSVAGFSNSKVPLVSKDNIAGFGDNKVPVVSKDNIAGFRDNKVPLVSKDNIAGFRDNKVPLVSKDHIAGTVSEGSVKKRKEVETNGFLHESEVRPTKLLRPSSSHQSVSSHQPAQNGKKLGTHQKTNPFSSNKPGISIDSEVENKECMGNGSTKGQPLSNGTIEGQPLSNGKTVGQPFSKSKPKASSAISDADQLAEASKRPPHPDSKYLSRVLSVPKVDEFSGFDDEEWLYGRKNAQVKHPDMCSDDVHKEQWVWSEAMQIDSVDICALPYVIPY